MKNILLFAGTTEGRLLAEYLINRPVRLHVCVATEYGRSLLPRADRLTISACRMDADNMTRFICTNHFDLVIDATHPYASDVTKNICAACAQTHTQYLRIIRDNLSSGTATDNTAAPLSCDAFVNNVPQAIEYLKRTDGPVFLTTGSKQLPDFMQIPKAAHRLFVRILPNADMLARCSALGLSGAHIFCMQGPFDTEMNLATIAHIRKIWQKEQSDNPDAPMLMITKQSGQAGGFAQKLEAARTAGIRLLIIGRPEDTEGLSLTEAMSWLANWCKQSESSPSTPETSPAKRTVTLIGAGMSRQQLTLEADAALRSCDLIIGAKRMLDMAADYKKPTFCSYDYPAIVDFMNNHPEYMHFAVLFSGDTGFYSGASALRRCLNGQPYILRNISGIASPIHFLGAIGKSWQDVHLISRHGQQTTVISHVRKHAKTLILLGKANDASDICRQLAACHLSDVTVYIGAELQQPDEVICHGRPDDFIGKAFSPLSMIYIENPSAAAQPMTHGLPDNAFIRGKVPMTKSEIRSIVLSKLALLKNAVFYDIGAGTGSVAIEAARQIPHGSVYAIEKNPDGTALIRTNSERLQTDNLTIIEGTAPDCLTGLPSPTHVFIGGSSGRLADILRLLYSQNPKLRIVITAITLETLSEIIQLKQTLCISEAEIIQVQVNNAKIAGPYHMMQGQNPIYIITLGEAQFI